MTREDIIRMAREAGGSDSDPSNLLTIPQLIRFAALVAEAEREALADYANALADAGWSAGSIADAIRARGSK